MRGTVRNMKKKVDIGSALSAQPKHIRSIFINIRNRTRARARIHVFGSDTLYQAANKTWSGAFHVHIYRRVLCDTFATCV